MKGAPLLDETRAALARAKRAPRRIPLGLRVFISVLAVWTVLLLGLQWVLYAFVRPSFVSLEERHAADDLVRIQNSIDEDLATLVTAARDYGTWDAMYSFVRNPSEQFVGANLADSVFSTLRIDLIQIYDLKGDAIYAKAVDGYSGVPHHFAESDPKVFLQRFALLPEYQAYNRHPFVERSGTFRLTDGRLIELVALPILGSSAQGPAGGTIVLGRLVTEVLLGALRTRTRINFDLITDGPEVPWATDLHAKLDGDKLVLSSLWKDGLGRPIAHLRISRPATVVQQGHRTIVIATVGTLVVLALVLLTLLGVLQYSIVLPLGRLAEALRRIETTGDLDTRLGLTRNDEIGNLAQSFDHLMALLGERAEALRHLATTDELTNVMNRRAIMDFLHQEIDRAIRYEHGLAILLIDVDWFKRINDTEGHAVGDHVLRNIAKVLKTTLRETDRVGRYGGEEFLVVMPHQTPDGATIAAERLRAAVEQFENKGVPWTVTISAGVAFWEGYSLEGLLYIADKNLYQAKLAGRNCVVAGDVALSELPKSSVAAIRLRPRRLTGSDVVS